jgi:RNA polymerase sigma-70 factor (ECF subfamily)
MERVRHEFHKATWQAFWGTAVDGRPAAEVGAELKMSTGAVYVAKSRVLARLREEVQRIEAEAEAW